MLVLVQQLNLPRGILQDMDILVRTDLVALVCIWHLQTVPPVNSTKPLVTIGNH